MSVREKFPHPLSQSTPLQSGPASSLAFLFRVSPQDFKTCLLGKSFHTLCHNLPRFRAAQRPLWSFSFGFPLKALKGFHPPPLHGSTSTLSLVHFFNQYGTPTKSTPFGAQRPYLHTSLCLPPSGPSVLTGTPPCVYPLRKIASSLAHRPMSGSDTIYNGPGPLLADIILFGFFLSSFPSRL